MTRYLVAFVLMLLPALSHAQAVATLVADTVSVPAGGDRLIAEGNVEVFFDGTRLSAQRITYDEPTDRLLIDGPIFIVEEDGTITTADTASLDPQLTNGILRGARLVLSDQLQLAANQIDRVEGGFTQLYQVAATSCHVCTDGGRPLWEIRARRVVHDEEAQQIYFDNATFHIRGVPVFYIPRLRVPDPTLDRATGLLVPNIISSDTQGIGITLPYFIRLGDHRDLTLTPHIVTRSTTLEAAYRQSFLHGDIAVDGAITDDEISDSTRGFVFAEGLFDLGNDVKLRFDFEYSSDNDYLREFDFSSKDRLDSAVSLERVLDRQFSQVSLTYFDSLRDGESTDTLPPLVLDASWERRITPGLGGTLTLQSDVLGFVRTSSEPDVGRDVARVGFGTQWHRNFETSQGIVIDGTIGADLDFFAVGDDSDTDDTLRSTVFGQTTLRYPLIRTGAAATHVIEPMVQVAWSDVQGGEVENEDSTATEFDQANLLALSRFSGKDAVEDGLRGALGLTWTRLGARGWDTTVTVGRVFRADEDRNFSESSGLRDTASDWLVAGQLRVPAGLSVESRLTVGADNGITKSETRAGWSGSDLDLNATYTFLPEDLDEDRDQDVGELSFDTNYQINETWSVGFDARYDFEADEATNAGFAVGWQNECVTVGFSVSRRFTTSSTLDDSTDFGLSIGLNGFSTGRSASTAAHRCTG